MTATTTNRSSVLRAGDLKAALGNAITALTSLDAEKLEKIEGEVSGMAAVNGGPPFAASTVELREIIARHRLLGTVLASTSLNLRFLERLHSRNSSGETSWVR